MNPAATGSIVFTCLSGAGFLGLRIRAALPHHHQSSETKDAVRILMGLVATMAALVLGLLVASTKEAYDSQKSGVTQMAAKIVFLDRVLAAYGPETAETRELLRRVVNSVVDRMWPGEATQAVQLDPTVSPGMALYDALQKLSPQNDTQRALKSQALATSVEIGQMRWLMFEQSGTSISLPLLIIVLAWIAIIFMSVGMFAPSNGTVIASVLFAAISVSGAVFLILELDSPFGGLIQISSEPMRGALRHLGN